MDYNYLFALLSLVVGVGAGFRDMYDHFQRAAFSGAATRWGLAYLASRGFVPAATFVILLASGLIENWLPATAIGCGLGLEAVLRAKIYLKREEDAKGNFQESYLEIFKLLQWYQDLMLVQAAELLSVQAQSTVRQYVEREENFQAMSDLFQENRGAWKRQDDIPPLEADISKLADEYNRKGGHAACPPVEDRILRSKLCYLVFSSLGKKGLQVLLRAKK